MTTFDERERGAEAAFAHDEDLHFRAISHRNHEIGLWAAQQLGKTGDDAQTYARSVVTAGVAKGGDDVILDRIEDDLRAGNVAIVRGDIVARMARLMSEAVLAQNAAPAPR